MFQHGLITCSRLAEEYELVLKYRKEFHDMFTEFSEHSEFGPLMTRMKVMDAHGGSKMDEEQWEAASESGLGYHTPQADIAPRHLYWIHLRETIVVNLFAFVFCSFRSAFLFLLSPASPFVYLYCPSQSPDTSPLVRRVPTFCFSLCV
jgi:hypothetical protein